MATKLWATLVICTFLACWLGANATARPITGTATELGGDSGSFHRKLLDVAVEAAKVGLRQLLQGNSLYARCTNPSLNDALSPDSPECLPIFNNSTGNGTFGGDLGGGGRRGF